MAANDIAYDVAINVTSQSHDVKELHLYVEQDGLRGDRHLVKNEDVKRFTFAPGIEVQFFLYALDDADNLSESAVVSDKVLVKDIFPPRIEATITVTPVEELEA